MDGYKDYDTNLLAMISALNKNLGEVMFYEYIRDEYRALGGRFEVCARTLEKVAETWPDCVRWIPSTRDGRRLVCKVAVDKLIEVKKN